MRLIPEIRCYILAAISSCPLHQWGKLQLKEMTTLDRAVLTAYGWPEHLSDDDILERLLGLNLERAAPPANSPPATRPTPTAPAPAQPGFHPAQALVVKSLSQTFRVCHKI